MQINQKGRGQTPFRESICHLGKEFDAYQSDHSGDAGMPVVLKYPDSASAKAFNEIIDKIVKTVE